MTCTPLLHSRIPDTYALLLPSPHLAYFLKAIPYLRLKGYVERYPPKVPLAG